MVLRPLDHPIAFKPGQWISVHLPLGDKPLVRAYTMAEPSDDGNTIVLCFDRVKQGAASTYLFNVSVGDRITVSDALGSFVLPDTFHGGIVFVTWFTGIVPVRCMLLEMARAMRRPPQTLLVYGAPNQDELPYHEELLDLARAHGWFSYVPVLPPPGIGLEGCVDHVLSRLQPALDSAFPDGAGPDRLHPMIPGIRAFVLPARAWFVQHLGFKPTEVQKETYD